MGKNTTVVFPAPLMTIITELGSFLASEEAAASPPRSPPDRIPPPAASANGGVAANGTAVK